MALYRGAGGAGDATGDSASEALLIRELAAEVTLDAAAAEAARAAAVVAKNAAETAETNAETAETNAETAEANAETAAASATSSASAAATSATNAAGSASAAATSATNAANSATSASTSASSATTSATNAASSASSASTSASTATTQATNASNSATSAASSATAAAASYDNFDDRYLGSKTSAPTLDNDGNALITGALYFNSTAGDMFVWNGSTWVTVSNTTSATNAANSAAAALTSETNAAASASSASTSATTATTQAGIATTQATNASNSATAAATSATNASNSATAASTSATNAASSATSASSSATSAATSAANAQAIVLGNEPVRHSVRPSLLLDFANTKILDPRITFTRGSTATFYDGRTVAKAEENLLLQSQDFTTTWVNTNTTDVANTEVAPDGTTTADTVSSTASDGIIAQSFSSLATGEYTFSIWIKRKTGTGNVQLAFQIGLGYTTVAVTSDWQRFSITRTTTATNPSAAIRLQTSGDEVFLWGAQLEQRSSVTAYTPTTTAPITNYIPALQTAGNNVPRFEHNPVTGESLGLEIEEQRTNLVTYSDDFANAAWAKTRASITPNTIIAPDGTLTGDKLVEDTTAANTHIASSAPFSVTNAVAYTSSVFAKAGERTQCRIVFSDTLTAFTAYYNLSTGAVISTSGTGATATITSVGNGWFRCTLSVTATATSSGAFAQVRTAVAGSDATNGDGFSGLFIWGYQVEAGSFATSYIPTVASQVTRSRDEAVMTGANFSSWFRTDEGTLYAEYGQTPNWSPGNFGLFALSSGTYNNGINMFVGSAVSPVFGVRVNSVDSAYLSENPITPSQFNKMAGAYKINDFARSSNGTTTATDNSGILPSGLTQANIGAFATTIGATNGFIRKLAYYPRRLTNAELQGLTTV